jgi:hypothetical protein
VRPRPKGAAASTTAGLARGAIALAALGLGAALGACEPADDQEAGANPATPNREWLDAIHTAGFECDEILAMQTVDETAMTLRIICAGAHVYLGSREPSGELSIMPIAYIAPPDPGHASNPSPNRP